MYIYINDKAKKKSSLPNWNGFYRNGNKYVFFGLWIQKIDSEQLQNNNVIGKKLVLTVLISNFHVWFCFVFCLVLFFCLSSILLSFEMNEYLDEEMYQSIHQSE